ACLAQKPGERGRLVEAGTRPVPAQARGRRAKARFIACRRLPMHFRPRYAETVALGRQAYMVFPDRLLLDGNLHGEPYVRGHVHLPLGVEPPGRPHHEWQLTSERDKLPHLQLPALHATCHRFQETEAALREVHSSVDESAS